MPGLGTVEIVILLVLVLVFFGAGRLSSIGTTLGRSIGMFRQGKKDADAIDITPKKNI